MLAGAGADIITVTWADSLGVDANANSLRIDVEGGDSFVLMPGLLLRAGKPDITKMKPFTLTMPDNRYWSVGRCVGKAWSIGKKKGARS